MRKEDRVRQQQGQSEQQPGGARQPQPTEQERVKGGGSAEQPKKPMRESGRLPLPD